MTIFGVDYSHYDAPDTRQAVAEGFAFMTHKAGGDANDPELGSWWTYMRPLRQRILLGAYWVLYPGRPAQRADDFLSRLDSQCPGWRDGPFILQLDCERWNGDASTQPGVADIEACADRLTGQAPELVPIVYASRGQYGDTLRGLGYPLWNARYPVSTTGTASGIYAQIGGDSGSGWVPYSGQVPAVWQFTSSATIGGQTTCDANAYRGTLAELVALVAPGWSNDMPYTEAQMRAFPWQYSGGGIPAGISTLNALNEILLNSRAILANVRADDGDQSALLAALGEIPAEVLAQLGDASVSPETAAGAIRELLGSAERVAAVKALL